MTIQLDGGSRAVECWPIFLWWSQTSNQGLLYMVGEKRSSSFQQMCFLCIRFVRDKINSIQQRTFTMCSILNYDFNGQDNCGSACQPTTMLRKSVTTCCQLQLFLDWGTGNLEPSSVGGLLSVGTFWITAGELLYSSIRRRILVKGGQKRKGRATYKFGNCLLQ